jgi:hypothetical protein
MANVNNCLERQLNQYYPNPLVLLGLFAANIKVNIWIDVHIIIRGYQNFQIALIH